MWIVLPTKDCKCATCEKLRTIVDEDGHLRPGSSFDLPMGPHVNVQVPPLCGRCGSPMTLTFWDRPGGAPGNGYRCYTCSPVSVVTGG
jgi:hypothetical protein